MNLDKNLGAHRGRTDVKELEFWNREFVKYICTADSDNRRDAILIFLKKQGVLFTEEQTLVIDAWNGVQNAIDFQLRKEPVYGKSGKEDKLAFWGRKLEYSVEICEILKYLKCNVVVSCHETWERDKEGELTGKLKPLQQGSFADQIGAYFTDVFRQHAKSKATKEQVEKPNFPFANYGVTGPKEMLEFQEKWWPGLPTMYLWQTRSDDIANCKTQLNNPPLYIPAYYEAYKLYPRNTQ